MQIRSLFFYVGLILRTERRDRETGEQTNQRDQNTTYYGGGNTKLLPQKGKEQFLKFSKSIRSFNKQYSNIIIDTFLCYVVL